MQLVKSEKREKSKQKIFIKKKKEAKIEKLTTGFQSICANSRVKSIQTVPYNNQMPQTENDRTIEKQNKPTPRPH